MLTPFYAKIKALQPRTPIKRVIATNIKDYLPPVLRLLFTVAKEKKEGHRVTLQPGDQWLGDLIKQHAASKPGVVIGPQDPALLLFSGGTTGLPKAALGTHQAIVMAADAVARLCAGSTGRLEGHSHLGHAELSGLWQHGDELLLRRPLADGGCA